MAKRRWPSAVFIVLCVVAALFVPAVVPRPAAAAPGHSVELRVLVLATGTRAADAARDVIETTLTNIGADYQVIDVSRSDLTVGSLRSGDVGRFNGIVITDNRLGGRLSSAEWAILHDYQRDFAVRQAVMSGPPSAQGGVGMGLNAAGTAGGGDRPVWTAAASTLFPYLETANGPILGVAAPTSVAVGGTDPRVTPLLRSSGGAVLVARLDYADGREVLFSSLNHTPWARASQVMAYAFVDFATRGLHLGAPRMFLSAHVDDVFYASDMWAIGTGGLGPEDFRLSAADWQAAIAAQRALNARFPAAAGFRLEHAFNGEGASRSPGVDPLTDAAVASGDTFMWLNHTFTHRNLDARNGWSRAVIENEVRDNNALWSAIGLPGADPLVQSALVTGQHSGLSNGTVPYPDGLNPVLVAAATATGIRYLAGDTSQPGQARPSFVPGSGGNLVLLPRWPTNLFYNVNTPARMTDEYNWIYRRSETYASLRALTAAQASTAISSFAHYPFFFHQANLHAYDAAGNSLLFDWLNDVVALHQTHFRLPLVTVAFHRIGELTEARLRRPTAGLRAQLAIATGQVTLQADNHPVTVELTGVTGPLYGPVPVRDVTVAGPVTFAAAGYVAPSGFAPPPGAAGPSPTPAPTPTPTPAPPTPAPAPALPSPSPTPIPPPGDDDRPSPVPTVPGDSPLPTPGPDAEPPVPRCKGRPATIVGSVGDDDLVGGPGDDVIVGLAGNDRIRGGGGDDLICAGPGRDVIVGGSGNDRIYGGGGGDRLVGRVGHDRLFGGPGTDRLLGGAGRDRLVGGAGADTCVGGRGRDTARTCEQ